MPAWMSVLAASQVQDEDERPRRKVIHRVVRCGGCWWDERPHYHCYCGRMIFSVATHLRSAEERGEQVARQ